MIKVAHFAEKQRNSRQHNRYKIKPALFAIISSMATVRAKTNHGIRFCFRCYFPRLTLTNLTITLWLALSNSCPASGADFRQVHLSAIQLLRLLRNLASRHLSSIIYIFR